MPRKQPKCEFPPGVCAGLGCSLPSRPQTWRGQTYCDGCYQRVLMMETREGSPAFVARTRYGDYVSGDDTATCRCRECGRMFSRKRMSDDGFCLGCAAGMN